MSELPWLLGLSPDMIWEYVSSELLRRGKDGLPEDLRERFTSMPVGWCRKTATEILKHHIDSPTALMIWSIKKFESTTAENIRLLVTTNHPQEVGPHERKRMVLDSKAKVYLHTWQPDIDDFPKTEWIESILLEWPWRHRNNREHARPTSSPVRSDTIGLGVQRHGAPTTLTEYTRFIPHIIELFTRWFEAQVNEGWWPFKGQFMATSYCLNNSWAIRIHRDEGNSGISYAVGLGKFRWGRLRTWPTAPDHIQFQELEMAEMTAIPTHKQMCVFDGRKPHGTEYVEGQRSSIIAFTCKSWASTRDADVAWLARQGVRWPTKKRMEKLLNTYQGPTMLRRLLDAPGPEECPCKPFELPRNQQPSLLPPPTPEGTAGPDSMQGSGSASDRSDSKS